MQIRALPHKPSKSGDYEAQSAKSPEGATYLSPGCSPGTINNQKCHQALKGRNNAKTGELILGDGRQKADNGRQTTDG
jgi:hypothetical protein